MRSTSAVLVALCGALIASPGAAAADDKSATTKVTDVSKGMPVPPAPVTRPAALARGEVRKIDKSAGTVTIRFGPIKNLGMSAGIRVFRVKEPTFLDQMQAGDRIRFAASEVDGALTVTNLDLRHNAGTRR